MRKELLTATDLAGDFRCSEATIYRLVREEGLPTIRLHDVADMRFDPEDIAQWLESRKAAD